VAIAWRPNPVSSEDEPAIKCGVSVRHGRRKKSPVVYAPGEQRSNGARAVIPSQELSGAAVNHLRALRATGETFSDVILRLAARGCYSAIMR
jgi:hypothetical protein